MKDNHYVYLGLKRKYLIFAIAVLSFTIFLGKCIVAKADEKTITSFQIGDITYQVLPDDTGTSSPSVSIYSTKKFFKQTGDYVIPSTVTYKGITYTIKQIGSKEITNDYYQYPFRWSSFSRSITIPGTVKTITSYSFENSDITELVIPSGVETIDVGSFKNCRNLRRLVLSDTVKNIGEDTFLNCEKLKEIIVDEDNPYLMAKDGAILSKDGKKLIYGPKTVKSYTIPEGVTEIGANAFFNSKLSQIEIPKNIKLGEKAFLQSMYLTKVKIGEGITEIPAFAFMNNHSLREVMIPDSVTKIGDYAFGNDVSGIAGKIEVLELPSGLQYIGSDAFLELRITQLKLPEGLTYLGKGAFGGCEQLTEVTIPSSLKTISSGAFGGCSKLTSVKIQEGVKEIHQNSFYNCSSLKSLNIPASAEIIQEGFLSWCNGINLSVAADNLNYKSVNNALYTKDGKTMLFYPINKTSYTIPKEVSDVGAYAIESKILKKLTIGKHVNNVYIDVGDCTKLTKVIFEGSTPPLGLKIEYIASGFGGFDGDIRKGITFIVPKGSLSKYKKVIDYKHVTLKEAR